MKRFVFVTLLMLTFSCSSSSKSGSATQISGAWTITASEVGASSSVFSVTLVSSQCSVSTPVGIFTVQGPACFIADDNTGQGSISGSGQFFYPPQGVLVGSATGTISANASATINLLLWKQTNTAMSLSSTAMEPSATGH
jgi:hypothetical protein